MFNRKLIVYIAMSLDGFIAGENDDLSFLDSVQIEGEDYGYYTFYDSVDCVILGRKTYDKVKSFGIPFPHKNKACYIITRQLLEPNEDGIFYQGDLKTLVDKLKANEGKHIFCDGGAELVNTLLKDSLVDEMIISVIPCILGKGTRLFEPTNYFNNLTLVETKSFKSGLVQLHYQINK